MFLCSSPSSYYYSSSFFLSSGSLWQPLEPSGQKSLTEVIGWIFDFPKCLTVRTNQSRRPSQQALNLEYMIFRTSLPLVIPFHLQRYLLTTINQIWWQSCQTGRIYSTSQKFGNFSLVLYILAKLSRPNFTVGFWTFGPIPEDKQGIWCHYTFGVFYPKCVTIQLAGRP